MHHTDSRMLNWIPDRTVLIPVPERFTFSLYLNASCSFKSLNSYVEVGKIYRFINVLQYIFSQFNIDSENPLNRFRRAAAPTTCCPSPDTSRSPRPAAGSASPAPRQRAEGPRLCLFMSDKNVPCSPRNSGTFSA